MPPGDEDIGAALTGHDRPVMRMFLPVHLPLRRKQAVLTYDPPHPARRCANAVCSQLYPNLATGFPVERRCLDDRLNLRQQFRIALGPLAPAPTAFILAAGRGVIPFRTRHGPGGQDAAFEPAADADGLPEALLAELDQRAVATVHGLLERDLLHLRAMGESVRIMDEQDADVAWPLPLERIREAPHGAAIGMVGRIMW